ncbi:hypothetical protein BX616_003247 [Lobosporangium transversale]|uniref:Uncharacterized protein n=1 Tax=Lobosporangium transversale TaxID=64571 RepID=A0A1Y2GZJ2_9FUNG|nr:hypothetical protein BCR41DRAFT_392174 [Lobosporangium transversale]KAF9918997.1 hypothetical protein BX616_003247 [Lobosporangium transversale]ORZ27719.1 hypothetical protein BCR41DRAFT_392174 [Lobosporangium transversale]|eukprot:XP_021885422.1 hypothetical protein BCR41DRAFT_392174 [Lobosporangium transversale]
MDDASTPWGLYALMVLCLTLAMSGLVWCICCGTCVGRDAMRAAGLSRFVPPPYMRPSFMSRGRYHRNRSKDEEEFSGDDIDMDVLVEEHHDSSVEYDYDFSEDDQSDNEMEGVPYSRRS